MCDDMHNPTNKVYNEYLHALRKLIIIILQQFIQQIGCRFTSVINLIQIATVSFHCEGYILGNLSRINNLSIK